MPELPPTPPGPAVKICGVTRREDAVLAASMGASWIGTVLVPSSPRAVDPQRARLLAADLPTPLVIVVADLPVADAARAAREAGAAVVQLHGDESPEGARRLREDGPWEVWKAIRVRSPEGLPERVAPFADAVDAVLLDGWHPRRLGGTGLRFSWEAVEVGRRAFPSSLRLVVAGGLHAGNVEEAVARLRPDAVDVSSGVEARPGIKDPGRLRDFFRAASRTSRETLPR